MTRQGRIKSKASVIKHSSKSIACGAVGLALLAWQARADDSYDPSWTKNFRLGALTGLGIKGQVKLRGSFSANGNNPAAGIYDDGYVRTEGPGNDSGLTSYWGYENATQVSGGNLTFHSASSFTANGSSSLDQDFSVGAELAYGGVIKQWERLRLGWEFGFGYLPISMKSSGSTPGSVSLNTYNYNLDGIIILGSSWHGQPNSDGPLLDSTVDSTSSSSAPGTVKMGGTLDADFFTFRLGPTLFYDVSSRFGLSGGIGPAFGILSETYQFNEKITYGSGSTAQAKGSFGNTDFVYGGYINLLGTVHVEPNGDLYMGVQYMPMSSSKFGKGGREASLDLSGQVYFTLGVSWIF